MRKIRRNNKNDKLDKQNIWISESFCKSIFTMSRPTQPYHHQHSHHHHDREGHQKHILERLNGVTDRNTLRHQTHNDEVMIRHHAADYESTKSKSNWVGGSGGVVSTGHEPQGKESQENLVHYDIHPMLDRSPLRHEHFYDDLCERDRILHERKHQHEREHHQHNKPTKRNSRSHSLPPNLDGNTRIGANFSSFPLSRTYKKTQRLPISHKISDLDLSGDENEKVENPQAPSSPMEKRNSGSNNTGGNNKQERFQLEFRESIENFKTRPKTNSIDDEILVSATEADEPIEYIGAGDDYNVRNAQRVSYTGESSDLQSSLKPTNNQSLLQQCRLRTECVEADDSDMNIPAGPPSGKRGNKQAFTISNNNNRHCLQGSLNAPIALCNPCDSQDFQVDNIMGNPNKARVLSSPSTTSIRFSQDSLHGVRRMTSNLYAKDVFPLPIEIPDNVADAEAFQRYLSVRRGAITTTDRPNISFERRNQQSSSYDSLGRRREGRSRSSLGVTASQLGQEASRRTASLSHAIMTLALLSASICQLRFLITYTHAHSYPVLNYFLIFTSIILEVAAGIGYVMIARCSYDNEQTEAIHNYLIFALFIVAVSNVVLAAFSFDDHICDDIKKTNGQSSSASQQNQQINQQVRNEGMMDLRYMPLE